jgi:hypothetical protein
MKKKFWGSWILLWVMVFVVAAGGCGGGDDGDDGDNGGKTFSDLPVVPPAPVTNGKWADVADTSWYSEDQTTFAISTAEQLAGLAFGFPGGTVTLANDIDLAGREWTPISFSSFDGGGHTISNMTITGDFGWAGLFSSVEGTIKNLNLTNVYINVSPTTYACSVGAIVGFIHDDDTAIENCTASGIISAFVQKGRSMTGGIVGENYGRIDNCTFSGSVFSSASESANPFIPNILPFAGGIVGVNLGEVMNSSSNGRVSSYPYGGAAGGIAGSNGYVGNNEGTVVNCKSGSDVSSYAQGPDAGGVVGHNYNMVLSSSSSGSVSSYNSNNTWYAAAGGIVARNYSGNVEDCSKTSGKITITNTKSQYAFAGGIIGTISEAETISGNTFSRAATGQQWGIGYDSRKNGDTSNDGATPTD